MAIVVEGVCRFKISQFRQRTPWYEADVEYFQDTPISGDDTKAVESFLRLKQLSRELIALLRMRGGGVGLPPMVARRLEVMIAKRGQEEAGGLADFMISAVETSLGERLGFLGETEVKGRVEKAVRILERQVGGIREGVNKKRGGMGPHLVVVDPRKAVGPGRRGKGREEEEEEKEADELEELGRRLSECGLTKEAEKVVKRELGRLKRMSPVQAEYGVCRTYLETLAEVGRTLHLIARRNTHGHRFRGRKPQTINSTTQPSPVPASNLTRTTTASKRLNAASSNTSPSSALSTNLTWNARPKKPPPPTPLL